MPIVVASSSCVGSAIAVIGRSPMRERRAPRIVVRIVGSRALGNFFPHPSGSSSRIGVCPFVVIGAPTVRLAEIVGVGCVAVATAAAAAITMRLRGRAAASGRPPPAVWALHCQNECRPLPLGSIRTRCWGFFFLRLLLVYSVARGRGRVGVFSSCGFSWYTQLLGAGG